MALPEDLETVEPVMPPPSKGRLTNQQILLGEKRDPLEILSGYPDGEWEDFVREWAESLTSDYREVRRASGKGDRGRDVIGYVEDVNSGGLWDNYQCKHYDHALYPSDLWKEFSALRESLTAPQSFMPPSLSAVPQETRRWSPPPA
jgi:hypothetical protein